MSDFKLFGDLFTTTFAKMTSDEANLFTVDIECDDLWDTYLNAFPEPVVIYKVRAENDCTCCRQVIKNLAGVVSITSSNNKMSVWDRMLESDDLKEPYLSVVKTMAKKVSRANIKKVWFSPESRVGARESRGLDKNDQITKFYHLNTIVDQKHVRPKADIPSLISEWMGHFTVFKSGLSQITPESIEVVLELIEANNLPRGPENRAILEGMLDLLKKSSKLKGNALRKYTFRNCTTYGARIKNTALGTFLVDLSKGDALEDALTSYGKKVSGDSYQRPKSLVTTRMIQEANTTIEELGLTPALERRVARASDISVNDIIYTNVATSKAMKGGILDIMEGSSGIKKSKFDSGKYDDAEVIPIDDFLADPENTRQELSLFVSNSDIQRFVTLTAPVNEYDNNLFKWKGNKFAWSYNGDVADSVIAQRVKSAGGNIDAFFRASLNWKHSDDLDIHCVETHKNGSQRHIYFKEPHGILDVDMNAHRIVDNPVENIAYSTPDKMKPGTYQIYINNYRRRNISNRGFTVELDLNGSIVTMEYKHTMAKGSNVAVCDVEYDPKKGLSLKKIYKGILSMGAISNDVWGIKTEDFAPINMIMNSPNHWENSGNVGNGHTFIMLKGCSCPTRVRGFYNEFLNPELNKHRKVFEILASHMKAEPIPDGLSGIGFTRTDNATALIKRGNRVLKVGF